MPRLSGTPRGDDDLVSGRLTRGGQALFARSLLRGLRDFFVPNRAALFITVDIQRDRSRRFLKSGYR